MVPNIPLCDLFTTPDQLADFLLLPQEEQDRILLARVEESPTARVMLACDLRRKGMGCVNPLENPQLRKAQEDWRHTVETEKLQISIHSPPDSGL